MINIEQIEYLKAKANISYEEAKALLEKYDGDVVKALCELEKEGKLSKEPQAKEKTFMDTLKDLFRKGNENRLVVKRREDIIANLSINFVIVVVVFGGHLALLSLLLILVLGYKIRFKKEKSSNTNYNVNEFVDKATANVKKTMSDFVKPEKDVKPAETRQNSDGYNEMTVE